MTLSDVISLSISGAAFVLSVIVAVFTWRANPRASLEVDESEPLQVVAGKPWDSEWDFKLTNRGRGDATYVRIYQEINGVKTLSEGDVTLRQGDTWEMTYAYTRAQVLELSNAMRSKSANRIVVVYRGNTDGKDKTIYFDPPLPI